MACLTLFAQSLAMTTTQLARAVRYEHVFPRRTEAGTQQNSVRLSWVVVTDDQGKRQLRMQWTTAGS